MTTSAFKKREIKTMAGAFSCHIERRALLQVKKRKEPYKAHASNLIW
ncbi:hypothetical protein NEOC65_001206 [Neochlamydia sp. AcF65]|nr:hypothetical protein [Neochlamydia sp. AcF65]MBS4170203.1 hypothetical protein [Neochlamydia sp. AcF95]